MPKHVHIGVDVQVRSTHNRKGDIDALFHAAAHYHGRSEGHQSGGGCGCNGPEYFFVFPTVGHARDFVSTLKHSATVCFATLSIGDKTWRVIDNPQTCHRDIPKDRRSFLSVASESSRSGGDPAMSTIRGGERKYLIRGRSPIPRISTRGICPAGQTFRRPRSGSRSRMGSCIRRQGLPGKAIHIGVAAYKMRHEGILRNHGYSQSDPSTGSRRRAMMSALKEWRDPLGLLRHMQLIVTRSRNRNTNRQGLIRMAHDMQWLGCKYGYSGFCRGRSASQIRAATKRYGGMPTTNLETAARAQMIRDDPQYQACLARRKLGNIGPPSSCWGMSSAWRQYAAASDRCDKQAQRRLFGTSSSRTGGGSSDDWWVVKTQDPTTRTNWTNYSSRHVMQAACQGTTIRDAWWWAFPSQRKAQQFRDLIADENRGRGMHLSIRRHQKQTCQIF